MIRGYVTNRPLSIEFRGVSIDIPKGHPVTKHIGGINVFFYADRPETLIDGKTNSMALHDATYYGIPIPDDAVSEKGRGYRPSHLNDGSVPAPG